MGSPMIGDESRFNENQASNWVRWTSNETPSKNQNEKQQAAKATESKWKHSSKTKTRNNAQEMLEKLYSWERDSTQPRLSAPGLTGEMKNLI